MSACQLASFRGSVPSICSTSPTADLMSALGAGVQDELTYWYQLRPFFQLTNRAAGISCAVRTYETDLSVSFSSLPKLTVPRPSRTKRHEGTCSTDVLPPCHLGSWGRSNTRFCPSTPHHTHPPHAQHRTGRTRITPRFAARFAHRPR